MVTLTVAREAVYKAFTDAWGTTTQVFFDNEVAHPAVNTDGTPLPWVRVSMRHLDSRQEWLQEVGKRNFLRIGSIFIQVFTPLDQGMTLNDQLAQQARAVFEGVTLNLTNPAIRFTSSIVREVGPDNGWNHTLVESKFQYDELK